MAQKRRAYFLTQLWILFAGIAVFVLSLSPGAHAQPHSVTLRRGQVLPLEVMREITSKTARPGEKVALKLARDLVADGVAVLPKDSIVYGRVTAVHRAGNNCHDGRLHWRLDFIVLANGQIITTQFVPNELLHGSSTPERVSFPSLGNKVVNGIGIGLEWFAWSPVVVVYSPLVIPVTIAKRAHCHADGNDKVIRQGDHFVLAVSKTIKIAH